MRFKGKNILITGAGSGIGMVAALKFAEQGAQLAILGRNKSKIENTRKDIEALNVPCIPLIADISDEGQMNRAFENLRESWDRIDVIFVNAGINGVWSPIDQFSVEDWDNTHTINVRGSFITVKLGIPLMKVNGGSIILNASINGISSFSKSGIAAYASSKAALVAFGKVAALELAPYQIRVNSICPGATESDIEEHMELKGQDSLINWIDYPRGFCPLTGEKFASADEVANTVIFLADDLSSHITGTTIIIDGGSSLIG